MYSMYNTILFSKVLCQMSVFCNIKFKITKTYKFYLKLQETVAHTSLQKQIHVYTKKMYI